MLAENRSKSMQCCRLERDERERERELADDRESLLVRVDEGARQGPMFTSAEYIVVGVYEYD